MDPALLKERKSFLKQASSFKVVEKRPATASSSRSGAATPSSAVASDFNYKASHHAVAAHSQGANTARFEVLARIVKYLMKRHLDGEVHFLSLDEIIDEMKDSKVSALPRTLYMWLEREALINNPKIRTEEGGAHSTIRFAFKPKYDIKSRKDLRNLLQRYEMRGLGGILKDDIIDSMKGAEKAIQMLNAEVVQITRPQDKKTVLYYNDPSLNVSVDEVFREHWRSCTVEGVTESKIEEYLNKVGITAITGEKKSFAPATNKASTFRRRRKGAVRLRDNEHVKDILEDYSAKYN